MPEEPKAENLQNVAEIDEVNIVVVSETSNSQAKVMSVLQTAPMEVDIVKAGVKDEDRDFTIAVKGCDLTTSDKIMEDMIAFVTERLQCLGEGSVEKFVLDEGVNVEEILCGITSAGEDGGDKIRSLCPNVTLGEDVDENDGRFSPRGEINQSLREELGSAMITPTPVKAAWPIYTKRLCSMLSD